MEKQLLVWGEFFRAGKKLTLNISFNYTEGRQTLKPGLRAIDKRGTSSAAQRMLLARQAEISAEEQATGQPPAWDHVYSLMRCSSGACELGPHCWRDPITKKHIKLTVQNLRALVNYAEQGGVLTSHDDVPESIREKLYIQEQQRLDRHKGGIQSTAGCHPKTSPTSSLRRLLLFLCQLHRLQCMCPGKYIADFLETLVCGTLLLLNIVTGSKHK